MTSQSGGKGLLIVALLLGLAAAATMAFVMIEPIRAYERGGIFEDSSLERTMMDYRMREAALPTAGGLGAGLLSVLLALVGRRASKSLFIAAMLLGGVSSALATYVLAVFPLQF
jgi:hypothetical protein